MEGQFFKVCKVLYDGHYWLFLLSMTTIGNFLADFENMPARVNFAIFATFMSYFIKKSRLFAKAV
jgi:uncharacterized membrane protein